MVFDPLSFTSRSLPRGRISGEHFHCLSVITGKLSQSTSAPLLSSELFFFGRQSEDNSPTFPMRWECRLNPFQFLDRGSLSPLGLRVPPDFFGGNLPSHTPFFAGR